MNPESKQKRIAFGYIRLVNNKIGIYEGQAAALQLIYSMYAEGKSLAEIKRILEGMNIPSPYSGRSGIVYLHARTGLVNRPYGCGEGQIFSCLQH